MSTREDLVRFIAGEFLQQLGVAEIPEDLDLIATGVIDSLGVLKVIAFLEERFSVSIAPEVMHPDNFSSIGAIMGVLQQQASTAQSP
jgi:acyl carrier protein